MYKKNDVIVLKNEREVVILKKIKETYIVYPLSEYGMPYKSIFKINEDEIKCRSNIYI